MKLLCRGLALGLSLFSFACSNDNQDSPDGGQTGLDAVSMDVTISIDTGIHPDATVQNDAMVMADTGIEADAGTVDATLPPDMGMTSEFGLDQRPTNSTCSPPDRPPSGGGNVTISRVYPQLPSLNRPLAAIQPPGNPRVWWVIEQPGRVVSFNNEPQVSRTQTVLDIRNRVEDGPNEAGLLGMAFHPNFANNLQVFLSYTTRTRGQLISRISRFTSADNGNTLDANSEQIILEENQPAGNHNGGHIAFGPDGFLYIAFGDGGGAGDTYMHGQNKDSVLGAILRIDVDNTQGPMPYRIPMDNPFAQGGGAAEIFAWGLRNPWRFSFDRSTGDLWTGDVGQNAYEEVDIVRLGGNYGWPIREGRHYYRSNNCPSAGFVDPVTEYGRRSGNSITGGYVYRGRDIPQLVGKYIYGDFGSGNVWVANPTADPNTWNSVSLSQSSLGISSFAEDLNGELYILDLFRGQMHKIVPQGQPPMDNFPKLLSETGCVNQQNPSEAAAGMVPYSVNAALWSDGAEKLRYFAIPDDQQLNIDADGDFEFPLGTVLMKHFSLGGRRFETRLYMRHDDGGWGGYSYRWNTAGTDADLLPDGRREEVAGKQWLYPSRAQCNQCHSQAAGNSLGLEIGQLNGLLTYPQTGRRANQLATLENVGFFASGLPNMPSQLTRLPEYTDSSASLEDRAKAYLHSNCSGCHRPGGPAQGNMDLRYSTILKEMGICNVDPQQGDLGVSGAKLVTPGMAGRSPAE